MNHNFKNSFFHMSSERPSGYACFVITVDIKKQYQHRIYEWHNCHNADLLHDAFKYLADKLNAYGMRVTVKNDCLQLLTSTATNEAGDFNAIKQFINKNIVVMNNLLDI